MADIIYFVELTGVPAVGGTEVVFGYCTGRRGYAVRDDDTGLAVTTRYAPRIISPGDYSRTLFARGGNLFGETTSSRGSIRLANLDGGLDSLRNYAFDGRAVKVMRGELSSGALTGAPTVVLQGRARRVRVSYGEVVVELVDRQAEFSARQLQPTKFAGTTGSSGIEGDEQLAGQPKPKGYGQVYDVNPPLVADGLLMYQVHDGQIEGIDEVTDGGDAITVGTAHSSLGALMAATVSSSTYDYFLGSSTSGAYIRLGTTPSYSVTVTFEGDKLGGVYASTVSDIAQRVAEEQGGLSTGEIDATAFAALEAANSSVVGVAYTAETTIAAVLDELFRSVGAWWAFDRSDILTCGRLELPDPADTPDLELTAANILGGDDVEPIQTEDLGVLGGIPVGRVTVGYQRNYTVIVGGQVDPNVTIADRAYYAREYREVVKTDDVILDIHPLSEPFRVDTQLTTLANATTEADRLLTMLSTEQIAIRLRVRPDTAAGINLGDHVRVTLGRLGLDGGQDFVLISISEDYGDDETTLTLWGGVDVATETFDSTSIVFDQTNLTWDIY